MNQNYDKNKVVQDNNNDKINDLTDEIHKLSNVTSEILDELQFITRKSKRYRENSSRSIKWISIVLVVYAILLIVKTVLY